jgi:hypothetical protein
MIRTVLSALALALALAAVPATAEAGWPGFYGCGYRDNFYGVWSNPYVYSQGAAYIPPYYAIHPPVYYSPHITARPYGASPYAWYPMPTPPVPMGAAVAAAAEPQLIENPYVKTAAPAAASASRMIENPYVKGAPRAAADTAPRMIDNPYYVAK